MCFKNAIDDTQDFEPIFTQEEYLSFINGVYKGKITKYNAPPLFYNKTALFLKQGLDEGLGDIIVSSKIESADYILTKKMTENVYYFSAAKTYQETIALQKAIFDENGMVLGFDDYLIEAQKILQTYNEIYLKIEQSMSLAMGRGARDWQTIQEDKEFLPIIQYETVGDSRVRPEHVKLDNITLPADDPFWDTYFPPNGWRCRCTTLQLTDSAKVTNIKNREMAVIEDIFAFNPGKKQIVYAEGHPYFTVPKEDEPLKANNFGFKPFKYD
jgi:SPP1 gp7 family putative phage head morphogenesis protein